MRKVLLFPVPALLVFVAMGCQPAEQELEPLRTAEQIQADIEALAATWLEMANAGDAAGVASTYTEDAVYMDPYGGIHHGRGAIQEYFGQSLARSTNWEAPIGGTVIQGDMVAGYGTWSATPILPEDAAPIGGRWQNVTVYQPDGSLKMRLQLAMIPAPTPEM